VAVCGALDVKMHCEFGVEDGSQVFKLEYLSNEVRARGARGGGWEGRLDMDGG